MEAATHIDNRHSNNNNRPNNRTRQPWEDDTPTLFLHWEYHPRDMSRKQICDEFMSTLEPALKDNGLRYKQLTIAYSNPSSLRRCLSRTQLEEPPGKCASNSISALQPELTAAPPPRVSPKPHS